jgi:hypothetical protein
MPIGVTSTLLLTDPTSHMCACTSPSTSPSQLRLIRIQLYISKPKSVTMTTSTFLNLPREIRDMIYDHLHHEIRYNWPWSKDNRMEELDVDIVEMNLENAPSIRALLVNKQVHDEYEEILKFRRFSATIATRPFPKRFAFSHKVFEKHRAEAALSHLHDVNVLILNHFCEHGIWTIVAKLAEFLVSKAPRLETMQIGTQLSSPNVAIHRDMHRPNYWMKYEAATHPMFRLESPPAFLAKDFALAIYGEGYRSGRAKTSRQSKLMPRPDESEMGDVQYFVERMGVYTYARAGANVRLMDKSVLVEQWPSSAVYWSCWTVRTER